MKQTSLRLLLLLALLLVACGGPAGEAEGEETTFALSGAFALYPMMVRFAEEYQATHPGVNFDITGGGAGKGVSDVLAGATDLGMVSRELNPDEIAQGAFPIAVTRDAVFFVVNAQNPYIDIILEKGVTTEALGKVWITGEYTTWGELLDEPSITEEIHVYTRSDSAGAAEMFSKFIGGEAQEDLLGIGVDSDPGLLQAVLADPLGVGFNNLGYIYSLATDHVVEGAVVPPIDINHNGAIEEHEFLETRSEAVAAILSGDYPSPPARLLYLVSRGKPSGAILDLLLWILQDGQAFVPEAGYVPLTEAELQAEIDKLR
ncbi:MAG: substrate-binding domain-containing protein [Anaerolineales bacterium]|nr:substrate-binding domain-containing protein [Anaerolineales bacterium]